MIITEPMAIPPTYHRKLPLTEADKAIVAGPTNSRRPVVYAVEKIIPVYICKPLIRTNEQIVIKPVETPVGKPQVA